MIEAREIPLKDIHESKWNPRKTFDKTAMDELTASIKQHGVLTPVLVRPSNGHFELAAGARRVKAAVAAGLQTIPAIEREMDDQTFREVLVVENLQRADVEPVEEAEGFKALMKNGQSVAQIAQRIGKSEQHVYGRLQLLNLIPEAKKLVQGKKLPVTSAILIARLKPKDQKRAIGDPKDARRLSGAFTFDYTGDLYTGKGARNVFKPVSSGELQKWIREQVRFDRADVDTFLFPETAQDLAEAKEQKLKIVPITLNHMLPPETKAEERTYTQRSWRQADGRKLLPERYEGNKKSRVCTKSVLGVFVVGPHQGETMQVCINRDCVTHFGKKANKKAQAKKDDQSEWKKRDEENQKRWAAEQAKREREFARFTAALPAIKAAFEKRIEKLPTKATGALATFIAEKRLKAGNADSALRQIGMLQIAEMLKSRWDWEALPKVGSALGVDVTGLLKAVTDEELLKHMPKAPEPELEEPEEIDGDEPEEDDEDEG